ncbi:MAG: phosphoribosylamine--glycine ligase [Marinilabiliaceae bacterium]|nr:phosphoribosylamine--glycine ligase [Marinilabiliaceae bacterium]
MNILILGSGGREHALGWKIRQSPLTKHLFFAQGNAGTASLGININVDYNDFEAVKQTVLENKIDLVVVGPEEPLVKGIVNYFFNDKELNGVKIIGPSKNGAQLEGSKDFAKKFMHRHNIPTARYLSIKSHNIVAAMDFMKQLQPPYVLKADGLAGGKGVLIIDDYAQACLELKNMHAGKFGDASKIVVIEEFLKGSELSVFVLTDGENYLILPEAKDYKRIGEGNTGLNTGGMGAISPVPAADTDFMKKVEEQIIKPTINGIKSEKIGYKGFIFFGIMNVNGNPYLIEYNVRMGDPETQVVLPRLKNDIVDLFIALHNKQLQEKTIEIYNGFVVTIVLVSGGYPENYNKGIKILNIENVDNSILFHSGTAIEYGKLVTNGGRVFAVTSFGETIESAREQAIDSANLINFEGKYFRKDIGS